MKEKIEFSEFLEIEKKLEIKVGKIVSVCGINKADKLIKLVVEYGNDELLPVVTNIKTHIGD